MKLREPICETQVNKLAAAPETSSMCIEMTKVMRKNNLCT
jgi:hypothetical protein